MAKYEGVSIPTDESEMSFEVLVATYRKLVEVLTGMSRNAKAGRRRSWTMTIGGDGI